MSIKIKLTEDQVLVIHADPEAWAQAYRNALENDGVIEVHSSGGRTLAINPRQILFWEEVPEEAPDRGSVAREAQPAPYALLDELHRHPDTWRR